MGNWLNRFSKNMLAFLAIAAGMVFIIATQPPHSICDTQIETIKEAQKKFLYKDPPKSKVVKTTLYETLRDRCKNSNNPGGCYELFQKIKALLDDLTTLPMECASAAGSVPEVQRALMETIELMVRMAWGNKAPGAYEAKFGWLDKADVSLFCGLRSRIGYVFGDSTYDRLRERLMLDLPGSKDMTRQQVWEMSLFSENCARYP